MNNETHENPTDDNRSLTHRLFITTRQPDQLMNNIAQALSVDPDLSTTALIEERTGIHGQLPRVCIDGPELYGSILVSFTTTSEYYYVNMECYQADSVMLDKLVSILGPILVHISSPKDLPSTLGSGCVHGLLRGIAESENSCVFFTGSAFEGARRCRFQDLKIISEGIHTYFNPETLKKGMFERVSNVNRDWERNRVVLHNGSKIELPFQCSIYCKKEMDFLRLVFNVDAASGRFIVGHVDAWTPVPF